MRRRRLHLDPPEFVLHGGTRVERAIRNTRTGVRPSAACAVWGDGAVADIALPVPPPHTGAMAHHYRIVAGRLNELVRRIDEAHPDRISDETGHAVKTLYIGITRLYGKGRHRVITTNPRSWQGRTGRYHRNHIHSRWNNTHRAGRHGLVFVAACIDAFPTDGDLACAWMVELERALHAPRHEDVFRARADGVVIASSVQGGVPRGSTGCALYLTWTLNDARA